MSNSSQHTVPSARRKWPWIALLCLIGLVGLARLSLMTAPVQGWVKKLIVETANQQLRPQFSVGRLSGDLWAGATLSDIRLIEQEDTLATIDTLHLEYDLMSYFGDVLKINQVQLVNPRLNLARQADQSWNVQHWLAAPEKSADTSSTLAFSVMDFNIRRGHLTVDSPQIPQDSSVVIDNLQLASSLGFTPSGYHVTLRNLNFTIRQTRLTAPVTVDAAAHADSASVTLEKLAVATGRSALQASGTVNVTDSTANLQLQAQPLSWKDVAAYAKEIPVREDIHLTLGVQGTASNFDVTLQARATGIEALQMESHVSYDSLLTLHSFRASAYRLDLQSFLGDTSMPALSDLQIQLQGSVPVSKYRQAQLQGTISARNIRLDRYRLDNIRGTVTLKRGSADLRLTSRLDGEQLSVNGTMNRMWSQTPALALQLEGDNINPANWLQDERYTGKLSMQAKVQGEGWYPAEKFWDYQLTFGQGQMMGQQFDQATFSGRFNRHTATNTSQIDIAQSSLQLEAEIQQLQQIPQFTYAFKVTGFNLADIHGLKKYTSSLNGAISGNGRGTSLENLRMQTTLKIDSSLFKGESIEGATVTGRLDSAMATIQKGVLQSSILDGQFNGQIYIYNFYHPNNILDIQLLLKDLSALAPVAGVQTLQATGTISGNLRPSGKDSVVLESSVNLRDLNYNDQFTAPRLSGGVRVDLAEHPAYSVDFDIRRPKLASVGLQNISLKSQGKLGEQAARGTFDLTLAGQGQDRIVQAGTYQLGSDSSLVTLTGFDLTTQLRTLSLQQPFHLRYANGVLKTDTLHIRSSEATGSAFMELSVPYADSLHQKIYLNSARLNLAAIQNATLEQVYLEGILSGEMHVDRTDTSMTASGNMVMSDLVYQQTKLDTLRLKATIENERLNGLLKLYQQGELIVDGALDIPFKAEKPTQLQDDFFEQPVRGHLDLHAVHLSRFETLLKQAGYTNTEGVLQFSGSLEGHAGQPKLNAQMYLKDARLSGVPVDSLVASAHYQHSESLLNLQATLTSLRQKALVADARMPLYVDLRTWDVGLANPQDSISVDVATNEFNLQALNIFLDRSVARNLRGQVDGEVTISGPRNNLQTDGKINLTKGAVRLVPAGIRLDHIQSTLQFKPNEMELTRLQMKSGNGTLNARGAVAMKKLIPGDLNLTIDARNFKVANTDEYNGIVNLNLDVTGSVTRPSLSGQIEVINGFVKLDNFGEKSVENVSLDTTLSPEPDISLYDSLGLDVNLSFDRRFWVRNKRYLEMELELEGQVNLLKKAGKDLQLFGTLNTADGYAQPLGKRFELEEGSLAFSGPPDNPQINVRTLYKPPQAEQEIKIWYIIEGTVENPRFKYESSPPMDLAGIISYTLFGQPFYKLNPAEQSVASTSSSNVAADFAVEVLLDQVEALATRKLGIDVVRIENTRVGGENGTSITTGWYINPKVFFAIQNVITGTTPSTGFVLEYYLKENLKLILSQGNDNRQGVDVQWEYDY